ncbi:MAG: 7-cyano-7-deazaguanine synthase QueC [Methanomassiliicoccales archaeon]|nr:MAG: 7-cyano-7-deazaguanine synthase QueC [Methanomassiliicoccales archaeon]
MTRAVVLLSGGLDSTVTMARAKEEGYMLYPLSFDYGQRHKKELECAGKIARYYEAQEHKILKIDLGQIGGSALTDVSIAIPEKRDLEEIGEDIPATYVPDRNTILHTLALGYAEVMKADAIFIGANALDYSGYPDCRPEYFEAFQKVAELGTKAGVEGRAIVIKYPLINMTKAEIVKEGTRLNVPFHLTWSCYYGQEKACGKCDSCLLRMKGFKEAGITDPIEYIKSGGGA